jgi:addiction module RelE/StbE family toxin
MDIHYHKNFPKSFMRFSPKIRQKIKDTIEQFQNNPHHPQLNNHALHGKFHGCRSVSASGDIRLIFVETGNYEQVEFFLVGTHSQLYE